MRTPKELYDKYISPITANTYGIKIGFLDCGSFEVHDGTIMSLNFSQCFFGLSNATPFEIFSAISKNRAFIIV